jgi:hypothetical protein
VSKSISFERPKKTAQGAEKWVASRSADDEAEEMKRFTLDVPASLHRRIKVECTMRGEKMSDVLRGMLEDAFPEDRK